MNGRGSRTRLLLGATAIAAIVTIVGGGSGVLAVVSDSATTGASGDPADMDSLETAAIEVEAGDADIQIARYPNDPACGPFHENLQLPIVRLTDVHPGDTALGASLVPPGVCVTNVGTDEVSVTMEAIDIESIEVTCEADEATVDPDGAGCGDDGEAAEHVRYRVSIAEDCPVNPEATGPYRDLDAGPTAVSALSPGEIVCLVLDLAYEPSTDNKAAAAQTDKVRWRFRFDAETT